MKKRIIILLILVFILNTSLLFLVFKKEWQKNQQGTTKGLTALKSETFTVINGSLSKFIQVFGQVGEHHLTIEGYTSPFALVELSTGLFTVTELRTADATGYFKFENILLHPFLSREPCLIATDKSRVSTPPLCLAEVPKGKDVYIYGVILAPSLVLEKSQRETGKTTRASGFTTPNSNVNLYLFREEKKLFWSSLIRRAEARGAPIFSFESNSRGYFEFNLPSYLPTTYRLFVASKFCPLSQNFCGDSPKSNTLKFQVLAFWQKIILSIYNLLYLLWLILKKVISNPFFLFLLEIVVIILLVFLLRRKKKNLAIIKSPERKLAIHKKSDD